MSYGLIYTVPFATLDNIPCVVEIEKEDYVGASTELTAGATPFTIDIDSEEFLYTPTRFSTAKLQVVGSDYLQSLFSTAYKEFRVTLKKNGVITWCGFIKPELYTQDYTAKTFTLEIECISAMSVLEFIDYSIEGESKKFVSLWNLLQRCISTADGQYDSVFIPHVYASSKAAYSTGENVLANMTLSEQDFFDEDDKPMKLKEVLEEVCKFLNWTCTDWKGDLYFVDVDHSGIYYKYDTQLKDNVETQAKELLVQDIGFVGAGHFLDILPGYNKATVKCSNYPVGQIFPDEDLDRLKLYASQDKQSGDKVTAKRFYYPNVYRLFHYSPQGTALSDEQFEAYKNNPDSLMLCQHFCRSLNSQHAGIDHDLLAVQITWCIFRISLMICCTCFVYFVDHFCCFLRLHFEHFHTIFIACIHRRIDIYIQNISVITKNIICTSSYSF